MGFFILPVQTTAGPFVHAAFMRGCSGSVPQNPGRWLSEKEVRVYSSLEGSRQLFFLSGRYAAKELVRKLYPKISLPEVSILNEPSGVPFIATEGVDLGLSLTHSGDLAGAVVFPQQDRVGIDLEQRDRPLRLGFDSRIFSTYEKEMLESLVPELRQELFLVLWTLKEACLKSLGLGIGHVLGGVFVSSLRREGDVFFADFEKNSFQGWVFLGNGVVCALVMEKNRILHPHPVLQQFQAGFEVSEGPD